MSGCCFSYRVYKLCITWPVDTYFSSFSNRFLFPKRNQEIIRQTELENRGVLCRRDTIFSLILFVKYRAIRRIFEIYIDRRLFTANLILIHAYQARAFAIVRKSLVARRNIFTINIPMFDSFRHKIFLASYSSLLPSPLIFVLGASNLRNDWKLR